MIPKNRASGLERCMEEAREEEANFSGFLLLPSLFLFGRESKWKKKRKQEEEIGRAHV